jgi:serine/threonine-protein kinase RsbW
MIYAEQVVRLTIDSQLPLIDLATSLTDNMTNLAGFDEDAVYWINMAVRESVANAVEHGNKYDPDKSVEITFVLAIEQLTITVRDYGEGFDPSDLPDPLDPLNLLNPAGRGILYMRTFMDEVAYQRHPGGGMLVTMAKRRPTSAEIDKAEGDEAAAHLKEGEAIRNVLGD